MENRRKGGLVIRPHFPFCGNTEDPIPILKGLVDALEVAYWGDTGYNFANQEWYRYLNCGYRVAVCAGTDKMGAYCPLGWVRTYAKLDPNQPFTYDAWSAAVRAGRTISTSGPLMDLQVEEQTIGDTIRMSASGGSVEIRASAESFWPLDNMEVLYNGRVIRQVKAAKKECRLSIRETFKVPGSGWIAARCMGADRLRAELPAAHTSPVYVQCGDTRAFDGPAAQHMLSLVEGGREYLNTIASHFDEASRRRMVKLFDEARAELKGRLLVERRQHVHSGDGAYHTHGDGTDADHDHA